MIARYSSLLLIVALLLAACGGAGDTAEAPPAADGDAAPALRPVMVAFAYIPNIQFAPFYVADSKGYYEEAGLDVAFDYNFETDVVQRVAAWPDSDVHFAHGSGLSVMLARQQDLPVRTVMTQYQQFPVVFFSKARYELETPEDLRDHAIGIPGRFGASYYGLQALLYASGIEESSLNIQEVGFNQLSLMLEDNIEVASGYAMNEPVKLREQGIDANVLRVADYFPLASDGIITSEALLQEDPDMVRAFIEATLRGLRDTLENPDEALELSLAYMPEVDPDSVDFERQVLQESLPYWESEQLGYNDPTTWAQSHTFLLDTGLLAAPIDIDAAYTNEFVE
jgi:NitT/TauT family transport system substrate-binding protein